MDTYTALSSKSFSEPILDGSNSNYTSLVAPNFEVGMISPYMTVCIAAIADKGKRLILASDNMFTLQVTGTTQYQKEDKDHQKIHKVNNNTYVLVSGGLNDAGSILKLVKVGANMKPDNVAEQVKIAWQTYYRKQIEDLYLKKYNMDLDFFNNQQKKLDQTFIADITAKISAFVPSAFLMVAGYDNDTKEFYIGTIGGWTLLDRTSEGFSTNGSGADLAKFSLILNNYNKDIPLADAEKLVKQAVQDAKKSPGVGELGQYIVLPESAPVKS